MVRRARWAVAAAVVGVCASVGLGQVVERGSGDQAAARPANADQSAVAGAGLFERVRAALHLANPDYQMLVVDTTPERPVSVPVVIDGVAMHLDMSPHSVRADNYRVLEHRAEGLVEVKPTPVNTLRGHVREVPGSVVAGGVMAEGLYATVIIPDPAAADGERRYWIQPAASAVPDAPEGLHVVYRNGEVTGPFAACTTEPSPEPSPGTTPVLRGGGWRAAQVAVDAEFQFYRQTGSSGRSQDMINLVLNIVNVQYEREVDIRHVISTIIVRTVQIYNPSDPNLNMRQQFQNYWNANHTGIARDVTFMFDGNGNGGQTAGGAAICNLTTAYCADGVDWPNLSYRTDVVAHEAGHAWSACHCPCTSPPYTMDPVINYANRFVGAPTNECASNTVAQIVAHRNSRTCLDPYGGPGNSPNDSCANALPIPCSTTERAYVCTFGFSNFGATRDGPTDGCRTGEADIWYLYVPACDGTCTVSTCGNTGFDTVLFAYNTTTCPPVTFTQVACNDDAPSCSSNSLNSTITFPTARGQGMLIRVAGFNGNQGAGILSVNQSFCGAPSNDSCVNAVTVGQGQDIGFSTVGATTGQGIDSGGIPRDSFLEAGCANADDAQISNDIWYRYVSPCSGTTRFSLCNSAFDTKIGVYGSCPTGDNQALACSDDSCGTRSTVDVNLAVGQAVLVRIGGYRGQVGTGVLRIDSLSCPIPGNDNCAGATTLTGLSGSNISGTIMGATPDGANTCGATGPDVWYRYVAPCDGTFAFSTCGTHDLGGANTGIDTVVSLHSGCPGTAANQLAGACNDDAFGPCGSLDQAPNRDSYVSAPMTAGQTVYIRVSVFAGAFATRPHRFNFSFTAPPPANDECSAAQAVGDGTYAFCTAGATHSAEFPTSCSNSSNDAWFLYTPACSGTARASLCGSGYDTFLAVYDTGDCSADTPALACNDDNGPACGGLQSSADFPVSAGSPYLIRVFGFSLNAGGGTLTVSCSGTAPEGACCNGTACTVGAPADCAGVYQGDGSACGPDGNPTTCCPANINGSNGVSVQDIFDFLAFFFAGDPAADFNQSGVISVQDIFDFLSAYFAGCT